MSLNGALIDIKSDKINFVSTDTKRLAIYTLKKANDKEFSLSIPKKAIMEMQKLFYEKIELFYGDNILIAKNEKFEFFTKLINDKFPDYEKVVPKEIKQKSLELQKFKGFFITESLVVPPGIEPGTQGFSVLCSTN